MKSQLPNGVVVDDDDASKTLLRTLREARADVVRHRHSCPQCQSLEGEMECPLMDAKIGYVIAIEAIMLDTL